MMEASPVAKRRRDDEVSGKDGTEVLRQYAIVEIVQKLTKLQEDMSLDTCTKEKIGNSLLEISYMLRSVSDADNHCTKCDGLGAAMTTKEMQTCSPEMLKEDVQKSKIFKKIDEAISIEEIQEIAEMDWPKSAFRCTEWQRQSILYMENTRLVMLDTKLDSQSTLVKALSLQFPALQKLLLRNPGAGKIAVLEASDSVLLEDDAVVDTPVVRRIFIGFIDVE